MRRSKVKAFIRRRRSALPVPWLHDLQYDPPDELLPTWSYTDVGPTRQESGTSPTFRAPMPSRDVGLESFESRRGGSPNPLQRSFILSPEKSERRRNPRPLDDRPRRLGRCRGCCESWAAGVKVPSGSTRSDSAFSVFWRRSRLARLAAFVCRRQAVVW